jgi:nicotinamidase-related amidase
MPSINIDGRFYRMYPPEKFLGHDEKALVLDTAHTVFLLVDVYGLGADLDKPGEKSDWMGLAADQNADPHDAIIVHKIRPALDAARRLNLPIIYTSNSAPRIALANSAYAEVKWNTLHLNKDELYAEDNIDPLEYHHGPSNVLKYSEIIKPCPTDYYVRKHTHSGFFDTRLDSLLRNLQCETLVCVGFALDMCLGATMLDALWRNYRVLLLRDCSYAVELPGIDDPPGSWTQRWILYTECAIGYTATADSWIKACDEALEAK